MVDDVNPGAVIVESILGQQRILERLSRIVESETARLDAVQSRLAALEKRLDALAKLTMDCVDRLGDPGGRLDPKSLDERISQLASRIDGLAGDGWA